MELHTEPAESNILWFSTQSTYSRKVVSNCNKHASAKTQTLDFALREHTNSMFDFKPRSPGLNFKKFLSKLIPIIAGQLAQMDSDRIVNCLQKIHRFVSVAMSFS